MVGVGASSVSKCIDGRFAHHPPLSASRGSPPGGEAHQMEPDDWCEADYLPLPAGEAARQAEALR